MVSKEEKIYEKKLTQLDDQIRKQSGKYISHIKQIFITFVNQWNINRIRKSEEDEVVINITYYDKSKSVVHAYHEQCFNIVNAIHLLYTRREPLFVHGENDYCKFLYELLDSISDKEKLFKIKSIEFSLEFKKMYKL